MGGGFEFWLYILYDAGDAFYDSPSREAQVRSWLQRRMVAPLATRGVALRFALLRFDNVLRKPGPAFNFMMVRTPEATRSLRGVHAESMRMAGSTS